MSRMHCLWVLLAVVVVAAGCGDKTEPAPTPDDGPALASTVPVVGEAQMIIDPETGFATQAFPPTMPRKQWHQDAWTPEECLECHETGEDDAPIVKHDGMSPLLLKGSCRTCHVMAPE